MRAMAALAVGAMAVLAAAVSGCGGGAEMASPARTGGDWGGGEHTASGPSGAAAGTTATATSAPPQADMPAPAPPAPREATVESESSGGSTWTTPEPAPQNRPGLGTEWGETRESHIRDVSFFRADPDQPFAVGQLFYNDRQGVEALAAYHGGTPSFRDVPEADGAITVSLRDAWGEPLEAMHVGDRTYVVGQEGERYSIVIANHTPRRFEAVATVDGLDVINGRPGSVTNRGYVLMPWANLEIDGFRQSEDAVAAFRFGKVRDSYAAERGDARNVGVIGVAFFAEAGDPGWSFQSDVRTRDTASPFPRDPRFAPPPR
jgi:hypothetical protein